MINWLHFPPTPSMKQAENDYFDAYNRYTQEVNEFNSFDGRCDQIMIVSLISKEFVFLKR